jgi:hypothetical protein
MTTYNVHISDPAPNGYDYNQDYYDAMDAWAQEHCASYVGYEVVDTADVSANWDEIGEYQFREEKDALAFTLKWKHT